MTTARSALDRARQAWERTQPQLTLDDQRAHEYDAIARAFTRLRALTDPRGHDLLAELERLCLLDHASTHVFSAALRRLTSAPDQGAADGDSAGTLEPLTSSGAHAPPPAPGEAAGGRGPINNLLKPW